jgi:hypothetical protein
LLVATPLFCAHQCFNRPETQRAYARHTHSWFRRKHSLGLAERNDRGFITVIPAAGDAR